MKRIFSLVALLSALLASIAPAAAAQETVEMIVVVKSGRSAHGLATAFGVTPRHVYTAALNGFAAALTPQQRDGLARHPDVAFLEADQLVEAAGTQTIPADSGLWGLDRIDQRPLPLWGGYSYTSAGAGVNAYIIDSGIQANHDEFGGRGKTVYDAINRTVIVPDCNGHGTYVASLVGGATYGVAKGVQLHGVKVLDCNGFGNIANTLDGIEWVIREGVKPAVATLSFTTTTSSDALKTAVTNLIGRGVFVAVAAGNRRLTAPSPDDACTITPANVAEAYTVAASNRDDTRLSTSNYGSCVDGYAPGGEVTGAWLNSAPNVTNTNIILSGTSASAGFVAGVAALYQAINGTTAPATIHSWLNTNATPNVITGNPTGTPNRLLHYDSSRRFVSAGGSYGCGLNQDGTARCWGRNDKGEATPPAGKFNEVRSARDHTCGLLADQTITCWGDNTSGRATPPSGTFIQLHSEGDHNCAVRTDRTVVCWGANPYGEASPPSGAFTQVSAGVDHSCGIRTNGTVACWGADLYGRTKPQSGTFIQVSDSTHYSCGVRNTGAVDCWGSTAHGTYPAPSGTFREVSTSISFVCGLRTDNTVLCWGTGNVGQLTPPSGKFAQISTGSDFACAVPINHGTTVCWGNSADGRTTPPSSW